MDRRCFLGRVLESELPHLSCATRNTACATLCPASLCRLPATKTSKVSAMLERAADGLVAGGKTGTFTPLFFFLARKPAAAAADKQ